MPVLHKKRRNVRSVEKEKTHPRKKNLIGGEERRASPWKKDLAAF